MLNIMMVGECMVELSPTNDENNFKQAFAGDVFNSAIYLKRCLLTKANVSFLSVAGTDKLSDQFIELMQQEQISTAHLYQSFKESLGLYLIHIDAQGERSFSYWRENSAAKQLMKHIKEDSLAKRFEDIDVVFLSGISLAILPEEDLAAFWLFIESLKQTGCKVVFDPNYRPALWQSVELAKWAIEKANLLADIVLPGVDDYMQLYGHETAEQVLDHLESLEIKEIIVKNGEYGVLTSHHGVRNHIKITAVKNVVDTTSAGDAFNAGYLSARLCNKPIPDSVQFAAKVAGCVIQHKGAIVPNDVFNNEISSLMKLEKAI